jgi:hypothetical protein
LQALLEAPSIQSAQKRSELLEEQRIQMEEKKRMKDEAIRLARQQEFDEEQRLEVFIVCTNLIARFVIYHFFAA